MYHELIPSEIVQSLFYTPYDCIERVMNNSDLVDILVTSTILIIVPFLLWNTFLMYMLYRSYAIFKKYINKDMEELFNRMAKTNGLIDQISVDIYNLTRTCDDRNENNTNYFQANTSRLEDIELSLKNHYNLYMDNKNAIIQYRAHNSTDEIKKHINSVIDDLHQLRSLVNTLQSKVLNNQSNDGNDSSDTERWVASQLASTNRSIDEKIVLASASLKQWVLQQKEEILTQMVINITKDDTSTPICKQAEQALKLAQYLESKIQSLGVDVSNVKTKISPYKTTNSREPSPIRNGTFDTNNKHELTDREIDNILEVVEIDPNMPPLSDIPTQHVTARLPNIPVADHH